MVDPAAMAVDSGNARVEVGNHVAHGAAVMAPSADRFSDPEMLRQFQPCSLYDTLMEPLEVVDGISVITGQSVNDTCVHARARAHTRRVHARYETLTGL